MDATPLRVRVRAGLLKGSEDAYVGDAASSLLYNAKHRTPDLETGFQGRTYEIREFFKSFENLNFKDLSTAHIQKLVDVHNLSVEKLLAEYTMKPKNLK